MRTKNVQNRKKINIGISVLLIAVMITGIFAFLTAQDSKTNVFTTGKIDIELMETVDGTTYDSSTEEVNAFENILPTNEVEKKPWVVNTGDNEAYIFMEIAVPLMQGAILDDENADKLNDGKPFLTTEVFTILNENGEEGVNEGWELINGPIMGTTPAEDKDGTLYNYYLYAYNKALDPEAETPALFNTVRAANYTDSSILGDKARIPIKAYAIQTELINVEEVRKDIVVTDTLTEAEMQSIWSDCANAEKYKTPGQVKFAGTGYKRYDGNTDMPFASSIKGTPIVLSYDEFLNNVEAATYLYGETGPGREYYRESGHEITFEETDGPYVPSNTTSIAPFAFYATTLQSIVIPETVTEIKMGAFAGCVNLQRVALPSGITRIEDYVFGNDMALEAIAIPEGVTYIGHHAFQACFGLKTINIPDSVSVISLYAFEGCNNVTKLKLPSNLQYLGKNSLGMTGLEEVEYDGITYRASNYQSYEAFQSAILSALQHNGVRYVDSVDHLIDSNIWGISNDINAMYNTFG